MSDLVSGLVALIAAIPSAVAGAEEADVIGLAAIAGFALGVVAYHTSIRRWRAMYSRGEAECWRCHGSGRERNS